MSSQRKRQANKENALRSCGPKSPAGMARAARNARTHGLGAAPESNPEVEVLARAIAGDAGAPEIMVQARRVAGAQALVQRTQQARNALIARLVEVIERRSDATDIAAASDVLERLTRLERYERSSLAQRRFAVRDFSHARAEATRCNPDLTKRSQKDQENQ